MKEEQEINGVCYVCGSPLIWDENADNCELDDYLDEEGTIVKRILCEHCGTQYGYYITKENDENAEDYQIICSDQGFGNCAHCGGTVVWSGDFMRSDYENDPSSGFELSEDDDALVRSLTCGHCGCQMEVFEPTPNEMKSGKYPYWNATNKE